MRAKHTGKRESTVANFLLAAAKCWARMFMATLSTDLERFLIGLKKVLVWLFYANQNTSVVCVLFHPAGHSFNHATPIVSVSWALAQKSSHSTPFFLTPKYHTCRLYWRNIITLCFPFLSLVASQCLPCMRSNDIYNKRLIRMLIE